MPSSHHGQKYAASWKRIFLDTCLFELSTPLRTKVLLWLSLFTFAFLIMFKPFNLDNLAISELLRTALGSSIILFFVGFALNELRAKGYWVFLKRPLISEAFYLAAFVFTCGGLVYLLRLESRYVELSWNSALQFQFFALIMAVTAHFLSRLLVSLIKLQRDLATRAELSDLPSQDPSRKMITLGLNGNDEAFSFPYEKWIAAKAAGNYVELHFNAANHRPTILVRATLKAVNASMQSEPSYFKCHRSYVVNLDYAVQLEGNSQSCTLRLNGLTDTIPVARNYEAALRQKLSSRSNTC